MIKQVMQCDGCNGLLRDGCGIVCSDHRTDDLERAAINCKWTGLLGGIWYCRSCQSIRKRETLVPLPLPSRRVRRAGQSAKAVQRELETPCFTRKGLSCFTRLADQYRQRHRHSLPCRKTQRPQALYGEHRPHTSSGPRPARWQQRRVERGCLRRGQPRFLREDASGPLACLRKRVVCSREHLSLMSRRRNQA